MSVTFEPDLAEIATRGATASLLLDGIKRVSDACVLRVLKTIDHEVTNGKMHAERALALVHELAAFRRLISHQEGEIQKGRAAANRMETGQ